MWVKYFWTPCSSSCFSSFFFRLWFWSPHFSLICPLNGRFCSWRPAVKRRTSLCRPKGDGWIPQGHWQLTFAQVPWSLYRTQLHINWRNWFHQQCVTRLLKLTLLWGTPAITLEVDKYQNGSESTILNMEKDSNTQDDQNLKRIWINKIYNNSSIYEHLPSSPTNYYRILF